MALLKTQALKKGNEEVQEEQQSQNTPYWKHREEEQANPDM